MLRRSVVTAVVCAALGVPLLSAPAPARTAPSAEPAVAAAEGRVARCRGVRATIVGTRKKDVLIGTRRRDVIVGRRGHDYIDGRGGRDLICGGPGHDVLNGGRKRDRLSGQRGTDYCQGERREHRFHRSCEAHAPSFDPPAPPPPTRAQLAAAPEAEPVSRVKERALRTGGPGINGDQWLSYDDPSCSRGAVDYHNLYLTGAYTNPSYVYSRSYVALWTPAAQDFVVDTVGYADRGYYQVPLGGQHYAINGGAYAMVAGQFSLHLHVVWWWDGASWVDERLYVPTLYEAAVNYLGLCIS